MKKILFFAALVIFSTQIFAQSNLIKAKTVDATQLLKLNGYSVAHITNDTTLADSSTVDLPTEYAVYKFVNNSLNNLSYVPFARTITIDGTAHDLSIDRSFTSYTFANQDLGLTGDRLHSGNNHIFTFQNFSQYHLGANGAGGTTDFYMRPGDAVQGTELTYSGSPGSAGVKVSAYGTYINGSNASTLNKASFTAYAQTGLAEVEGWKNATGTAYFTRVYPDSIALQHYNANTVTTTSLIHAELGKIGFPSLDSTTSPRGFIGYDQNGWLHRYAAPAVGGGTVTGLTATNKTGQTWTITNPNSAPNIDLALTKDAVGLSNVENTAISTWPGSSNITTVGQLNGLNVNNTFTLKQTSTSLYSLATFNFQNLANAPENQQLSWSLENDVAGGGGIGTFYIRHQNIDGGTGYVNLMSYSLNGLNSFLQFSSPTRFIFNTGNGTKTMSEAGEFSSSGKFLLGFTSESGTAKLQVSGSGYFSGNVGIGSNNPAYPLQVSSSTTATGGIARGTYIVPTLNAAANGDVLIGIDINPSFNDGAFTGITHYSARFQNAVQISNGVLSLSTNSPIQQGNGFVISPGTNPIIRPFNAAAYDLALNNSTSALRIQTDGNITIGTTTNNGVDKLQVNGSISASGMNYADAANISFGSTTGTKIGTATTQKLGFWNATPIVKPSGSVIQALQNVGLISSATIAESELSYSDNTAGNVSISQHGFAPKAPNDPSQFLDGTGAWRKPDYNDNLSQLLDVHVASPSEGQTIRYNSTTSQWDNVTDNGTVWISGFNVSTLAASTTSYAYINGQGNLAAENTKTYGIGASGTLSNFTLFTSGTQSATGSVVVTVRVNGVNTGITVTIPAGSSATSYTDTTHTVAISKGDTITLQFVNNATATSLTFINSTISFK